MGVSEAFQYRMQLNDALIAFETIHALEIIQEQTGTGRAQFGYTGEMEVTGALCKGLILGGAGGGSRTPTGLPLLDFESDEPVTYQHLAKHITQNQRSFLSRVTPLCSVCAVGLGTILGTVGDYRKPASKLSRLGLN